MAPQQGEYRGLLFGPGLAAAGAPVPVRFEHSQMVTRLPSGMTLSRAYAQLAVQRAGFNESCLSFSWTQGNAAWSLMLTDAEACRQVMAAPPAGLEAMLAALGRQQRKAGRRRALGLGALGLWIAAPLLLLILLLFAAGPLVSRATALVSVEREQQLGAALFKTQRLRLDLLEGSAANAAVERIGGRLTRGSAYRYHWFVTRDPSINAFAIPGGYVVVHTGLIEAAGSPEELAGVLAHEVQHVEQRHSLQQLARGLGLRAAMTLVLGDVGTMGGIAGQLAEMKFSRDHEREADLRGVASLRSAGIDPQGMVSMFRKLDQAAAGLGPPALLSSHPATAERIAALQAAVDAASAEERGAQQALPIDWDAVHSGLRPGPQS